MSNIDIAKKYQTRDGQEARIYAADAGGSYPVHGAIHNGKAWALCQWQSDGKSFSRTDYDLIPMKQWRAWKDGEAPKFFMARSKTDYAYMVVRSTDVIINNLFSSYEWLHEDGTITPCGALEP